MNIIAQEARFRQRVVKLRCGCIAHITRNQEQRKAIHEILDRDFA